MSKDNRDIEKRIKKEAENFTPDVWDSVKKDIKNGKGEVVTLPKEKRKGKIIRFISSVAAALVLISAAVFGITNYDRIEGKVASTVYLEVNPQIELSLNAYNKVLDVVAKNSAAQKVIGTMNLKDSELEVALNAILGSMFKNGYLTADANSILISVENESRAEANKLQKLLLSNVGRPIADDFKVSAVVQNAKFTDELKATADNLNISSGKAEFIELIQNNGVKASKEDLAKLSVHELNLIFQSLKDHDIYEYNNQDVYGGVGYNGAATDNRYLSLEKVKELVFKDSGVNEKDVRDFEAELDYDYGKMVYEVEFEVGKVDYYYELDAVNGSVIYSNKMTSNPKFEVNDNKVDPPASSEPSTSSKPSNEIDAIISPERALEYALAHAGVDKKSAKDVDVEIDMEYGEAKHYDVDFKADQYEYEYEIDAINGNVLKSEKERND